MTTAVAAAKTDSSPILVLSGEVPVDMEGLDQFQAASQATLDDTSIMRPVTRLSVTVASTKNLSHWFRYGMTSMLAQPSGPVHLSLTHDVLVGDCDADYAPIPPFFNDVTPLSLPAAERAIGLLGKGAGVMGSKIPQQARAMVRDFTSHLSLGLGLYIGALVAGLI